MQGAPALFPVCASSRNQCAQKLKQLKILPRPSQTDSLLSRRGYTQGTAAQLEAQETWDALADRPSAPL